MGDIISRDNAHHGRSGLPLQRLRAPLSQS
jgi:hypothetical protein